MKSLFLVLLIVTSSAIHAKPKYHGSVTISEVRSIYAGDTFKATIEDWHPLIGESIDIRVNGIDTPEMRGKCEQEKLLARKAKKHAVAMLRAGKIITLENMHRDKYFRIVADVYIDGKSLTGSLIGADLGAIYYGKTKKKNWCRSK